MFAFSDPIENTKPSRVNRRRKKKWRNLKLTSMFDTAMLSSHSQKTSVGRGNSFSLAIKTPTLQSGVFLCSSFSRPLRSCLSVMAGLFGQRSALAVSESGFPPHASPSPDTVESIRGGLFLISGVTAMTTSNQAQTAQNPQNEIESTIKVLSATLALLQKNPSDQKILSWAQADCEKLKNAIEHEHTHIQKNPTDILIDHSLELSSWLHAVRDVKDNLRLSYYYAIRNTLNNALVVVDATIDQLRMEG